ncbi:MAG: alpha-amylase family protein [Planctomycetota bacterium]
MNKNFNSLYLIIMVFLITSLITAQTTEKLTPDINVGLEALKNNPKRLKRCDSFLGIHFDLHASKKCTRIGENVTEQMIEDIIKKVRPDYIQCDCKGHTGISSYPTQVGNQAGGFVRDQLKIWRQVTAKYGVALYMHYSGVYDREAVKLHPEWARIDENGKPDTQMTSVFGPYVDELLIPQLKELRKYYGIDGLWIDGECWATKRDYSPAAIKKFQQTTGIKTIPRKSSDPHYFEFSQFCRQAFRDYLAHYVDELHKFDPDFQIASNWAYTSLMPEPVKTNVDFLSGDYSAQISVNSARRQGRFLRQQSKPWDLMAWSFSSKEGAERSCRTQKSATQLKQEAAIVLALGGGFQAYFRQKSDCSIYPWQMNVMAEVAKFCRDRQKFCHKAQSVPQIALLLSRENLYRKSSRLFGGWGHDITALRGALKCLLDCQYSVDILAEHNLTGKMNDYPLIVIPQCDYLEHDFKDQLLEYTKQGGKLLLIGPKTAALFEEPLGIKLQDTPSVKRQWLYHNNHLGGIRTISQKARLNPNATEFGRIYPQNDFIGDSIPAASITNYGKGRIAAAYFNMADRYINAYTFVLRDFIGSLVKNLFPDPIVEVKGSRTVDVVVNKIDGKLAVNLVNTAGPHADKNIYAFDEIPPVGPLDVVIRTNKKPKKVTLEPGSIKLKYKYKDGQIKLTVPKLQIHKVIIIH